MIIPSRYNGPPESANGGYACGLLAQRLGGAAEVTLRRPPPLSVELEVVEIDGGLELRRGDVLVAEARPFELELDVPESVALADAVEASKHFAGFEHHAYPTCFTCGPARDDGLRIFAGPVADGAGLVAAPWIPREDVRPEILWAALDCPAGWAVDDFQREGVLLGRMGARILAVPGPDATCVVVGWRAGEEGRKRRAGSALFTAKGELLACSRSTWIVPSAA